MASITCRAGGPAHAHATADAVWACYTAGGPRPAAAAPRPNDGHPLRQVIHVHDEPTERQLWRVGKEKGDVEYARTLNRGQVSRYIDSLINAKKDKPVTHVRPPVISPMLVTLLSGLKDGRYAWRPDANTRWTFVRVSRPKKGDYAGAIKVQTQHSDSLTDRMKVYPDGSGQFHQSNHWLEQIIIGICMGATQASIDYGREKEQCCCCGRTLTDDRSIHYSIGPECEKKMSHIIGLRDEQEGAPYERLARVR